MPWGTIGYIAGIVGGIFFLAAYILVSRRKISADGLFFQWLNFFGAVGIGTNTLVQKAYPVFILEIIWIALTIIAIGKIFALKHKRDA